MGGLVDRLHDAAVPALKAIEEKNAKGLFDAGEHMEQACEACHQQYWYPPGEASAWKHEPGGRLSMTHRLRPCRQARAERSAGHIGVKGTIPGNAVIRMGMDPKCAALNAGKRPVQEIVSAGADGGLANVFVSLEGTFPLRPFPPSP